MSPISCAHDTLHTITTEYDHKQQVLVYYRECEDCGSRLGEVVRLDYRPDFKPDGNDEYLEAA
jgi:hypothetical protein